MSAVTAFAHFIFPEVCLHCQKMVEENKKMLCSACCEQMPFLPQEGRCLKCFNESDTKICEKCRKTSSHFKRIAGCFDPQGPASALANEFGRRGTFLMAKDLAALMVFQFFQLGWPWPDFLIPLPISLIRFFQCGYQKNLLLAQEMGHFLEKPALDILKQSILDNTITLKKKVEVSDRVLLLVADQINTEELIERCSTLLSLGAPKAIYALSFSIF